jgi:hypothetical protein
MPRMMPFTLLRSVPGASRAGPVCAAVMTLAAIGCDTLTEDFGAMMESITPISPQQAAVLAVDPHDSDNRSRGVALLSSASFGAAEPYLRMYRDYAANDGDPIVRAFAIRGLARHGTPDDALIIAEQLGHENRHVRWEAARGLQRLHHPGAIPPLLRIVTNEEEDADVRIAAATALGQYPDDRVFHGLVAALRSRELAVNQAARGSLRTVTGRDFEDDWTAWLAWYREEPSPFVADIAYLYPTYVRHVRWYEKLAFWSPQIFEQPAPPAGLRPETRSTYGDDGKDNGGDGKDG